MTWSHCSSDILTVPDIGPQTDHFLFDHGVAFARAALQSASLEHRDVCTAVTNKPGMLQFRGRLSNTFPAHTEHAGD